MWEREEVVVIGRHHRVLQAFNFFWDSDGAKMGTETALSEEAEDLSKLCLFPLDNRYFHETSRCL